MCNFDTDSSFIPDAEECAQACCITSSIYCPTYCLAVVARNVSSVSIKQFDSIIALYVTRHVLSNTIALSNMLRGENDNLIQEKRKWGSGNSVMTEKRNEPMVWDELY